MSSLRQLWVVVVVSLAVLRVAAACVPGVLLAAVIRTVAALAKISTAEISALSPLTEIVSLGTSFVASVVLEITLSYRRHRTDSQREEETAPNDHGNVGDCRQHRDGFKEALDQRSRAWQHAWRVMNAEASRPPALFGVMPIPAAVTSPYVAYALCLVHAGLRCFGDVILPAVVTADPHFNFSGQAALGIASLALAYDRLLLRGSSCLRPGTPSGHVFTNGKHKISQQCQQQSLLRRHPHELAVLGLAVIAHVTAYAVHAWALNFVLEPASTTSSATAMTISLERVMLHYIPLAATAWMLPGGSVLHAAPLLILLPLSRGTAVNIERVLTPGAWYVPLLPVVVIFTRFFADANDGLSAENIDEESDICCLHAAAACALATLTEEPHATVQQLQQRHTAFLESCAAVAGRVLPSRDARSALRCAKKVKGSKWARFCSRTLAPPRLVRNLTLGLATLRQPPRDATDEVDVLPGPGVAAGELGDFELALLEDGDSFPGITDADVDFESHKSRLRRSWLTGRRHKFLIGMASAAQFANSVVTSVATAQNAGVTSHSHAQSREDRDNALYRKRYEAKYWGVFTLPSVDFTATGWGFAKRWALAAAISIAITGAAPYTVVVAGLTASSSADTAAAGGGGDANGSPGMIYIVAAATVLICAAIAHASATVFVFRNLRVLCAVGAYARFTTKLSRPQFGFFLHAAALRQHASLSVRGARFSDPPGRKNGASHPQDHLPLDGDSEQRNARAWDLAYDISLDAAQIPPETALAATVPASIVPVDVVGAFVAPFLREAGDVIALPQLPTAIATTAMNPAAAA